MKTPDRVLDVDSNLSGERIEMSIEAGSMGHIMGILTELYSDAETAVLREYSTNARDAHVAAGVARPIEVTLPTPKQPNLTIRDFGEGLDEHDVREIYSRYGASTKRQSDDVVGMLGLGCKSALAYTDQFTLSGVKGGVMTVVSVARTEDGGGDMTLVSVDEVGDGVPSGVCVTIPCKQANAFAEKAAKLFRFWPAGTVRVNGEEPERIDGFWVAPDLLLTKDAGADVVVMGGVPYPMYEKSVTESYDYKYMRRRNGWWQVAFVGIGEVSFVPSREQLMFNAKTRETVKRIERRFEAELAPSIKRQAEAAQTAEEALEIALLADDMPDFKEKVTWRGQVVPTTYDFGRGQVMKLQGEKRNGRRDDDHYERLRAAELRGDVIFFTEYDGLAWSPSRRAKLELWLERKGLERPDHFVVITGPMPPDLRTWIGDAPVHDWRVGPPLEKAERRERTRRTAAEGSTGINAGVYTVRDLSLSPGDSVYQRDVDASAIDRSRPILFTFKNVESWGVIKEQREAPDRIARHCDPDAQIVILGLNRAAKFQRDFRRAENLEAYNLRKTKEWLAALSEDDKVYLRIASSVGLHAFSSLDPERLDDPALKDAVRIASAKRATLEEERRIFGVAVDGTFKDPREPYPLFPHHFTPKVKEHVYTYVNAVYAERGRRS